jgi:hypothetical protein
MSFSNNVRYSFGKKKRNRKRLNELVFITSFGKKKKETENDTMN